VFFREKLFIEVGDDCWLLMDSMAPRSTWNVVVFVFALLIFAVGVTNLVMLGRYLLSLKK
jgi:hypothetical protein